MRLLKPSKIKNTVKQMHFGMEVLQSEPRLSENEEWESESWDKIKATVLEANQMISQGMAAAQEMINQELAKLESGVQDKELYEDVLSDQMQQLTMEYRMYEEMISKLGEMQSSVVLEKSPIILRMIENQRNMLIKTQLILKVIQGKLQTRYATDTIFTLFQPLILLLDALENAMNDIGVYISGEGTLSDESWRVEIPKAIERVSGCRVTAEIDKDDKNE